MENQKSIAQYIKEIFILLKRNVFHLVYFIVTGLVIGVVYAYWIQDNNYTSTGKLIITQSITDAQRETIVTSLMSIEFTDLVATELNAEYATLPNGNALTGAYVASGINASYTSNSPSIVVTFSSPYQALTLETLNTILDEFVSYSNAKFTFVNSTLNVSERSTVATSNGYSPLVIFPVAILLGLFVGGAVVVFTDYRTGKILFSTDVEGLGYRVYSLTKVDKFKGQEVKKNQANTKIINLQNYLESNIPNRFLKTIAFSSFSSTIGNDELLDKVARTYADNGQKTLIIDLDLIKPNLNAKYNFSQKLNIVDLVESEEEELKFELIQDNLSFLAGKEITYPGRFFKSDKFKVVIDKLAKEFDIILFRLSQVDDDITNLGALDKFDFIVTSVVVNKTAKDKLGAYLETIKKNKYENVVINTFE